MSSHTEPADLVTGLDPLIAAVRSTVQQGLSAAVTVETVAEHLAHWLTEPPPLPTSYRHSNPDHYLQHLIHAEPDGSFSLAALVWLPGQQTPVHDHVSWCATGVYEGEEHEEAYELHGSGAATKLIPTATTTNPPGAISALTPPGDIHRVTNTSDALTISLHVYGADLVDLGSSVRRTYDRPIAPKGGSR